MDLKQNFKCSISLILIVLLATTTNSSYAHNQQYDSQDQPTNTVLPQRNIFRVPFLVLMSSHEISVAQLPLIDNGNISVAYRLIDDNPNTIESRDGSAKIADAREYEQMPGSSKSLGKSEQQQIVSREQSSSHDQEEAKRKNEYASARTEADKIGNNSIRIEETRTLPRKKRSSDSNSLLAADESSSNNSHDVRTVPESSSSESTVNVTAARSYEEEEEVVRGGRKEEDETINDSVQFSDFDVHMSLGFAFVADTRGRIHRFKLDGYGDKTTKSGNDYTNTIEVKTTFGVSSSTLADKLSSSLSERNVSPQYSTLDETNKIGTSNDGNVSSHHDSSTKWLLSSEAYDANKVELNSAHEQLGRHPTTSGLKKSAEHSTKERRYEVFSASDSAVAHPSAFGSNYDKNHQRVSSLIDKAIPKIIWSRTRHRGTVAHHLKRFQTVEKEALSQRQNHSNDINQTLGDTEKLGSESGEQPASKLSNIETESIEQTTSELTGNLEATTARTEIAVDWLNNLLFVLDKHRLLVLDYDGDNELVLIDDFNDNNRPIDLKVDPTNGFLFWLQVGRFHNTVYKLDLNVLTTDRFSTKLQTSSVEMVALISHHYAHPIITNLPTHTKLFTIDHKHSKIYVPLITKSKDSNKTLRTEDTEIFAAQSINSDVITHMNSTSAQVRDTSIYDEEKNCSYRDTNLFDECFILAYNLDGTDVGPLRTASEKGHLFGLDDIQDITIDSEKGFLYWLTNDGRELFEEYKSERDASFYSAQHNLDGKKYNKLIHFNKGINQPLINKPRFNLRNFIHVLASSTSANRLVRSDGENILDENAASGLNGYKRIDSDDTRISRNAPLIILGITCLAVLLVYLIYAFIFQQSVRSTNIGPSHDGSSIGGSYNGESQVDGVVNTHGLLGSSAISRWLVKRSGSGSNSTFNHGTSRTGQLEPSDLESSIIYDRSNAIDEHYRDSFYDQAVLQMENNHLTNINAWPSNICEMSNKLYVPIEVLEDETLSSINRISIDQLDIEKKAVLGEGHFGTVLQGTITCTTIEKNAMLNKSFIQPITTVITDTSEFQSRGTSQSPRNNILASSSSGHGSSSTSSEFITATSGWGFFNSEYLSPRTHVDNECSPSSLTSSTHDSCISYLNTGPQTDPKSSCLSKTTLKVAIKKLKDNASSKERSDFLQEAKLLAKFNHPNIVHLIGICLDRGSTLIVMELMLGGDLIRYMQENRTNFESIDRLTSEDLLDICLDIANACCYLEEHEHIHRDLAARNCLVTSRKREERVVKLADFGLARDIYKDSYYKKLNDSAMPLKWMAPECFVEQKFTIKSDVWSFGVVMWEVLSYCQEKPYNNVEPFMMRDHLIKGLRLKRPENCGEDIYRLMNDCWQLNPENRPSFCECRATLIEMKNSMTNYTATDC